MCPTETYLLVFHALGRRQHAATARQNFQNPTNDRFTELGTHNTMRGDTDVSKKLTYVLANDCKYHS